MVRLACRGCGTGRTGVHDGPNEWRCVHCGGALTPQLPNFTDWGKAVTELPGVGRYAALLPVAEPNDLVSQEAALTPVPSPGLAEALGVESVLLLPQTRNETGTFKDNEGILLATKCKEWGIASVCMHSSGNTARAYQYYMARHGIVCTGFVPSASAHKCPTQAMGKSTIAVVDGTMAMAAEAALAHSVDKGHTRLAPTQWKIEGKVPIGLALAERCPEATVIAVTVASGYGPLGMERGLQRARAAGLPSVGHHSYRLFQAADAGALGSAIRTGRKTVDPADSAPPERAFEPTLQSTNPNKTLPLVRQLVADTRSRIDAVSPERVEEEAQLLIEACTESNIPLDYASEKSAFICWAGLRQAATSGRLLPSEQIVMIVSGSAPRTMLP